MNLREGKENLAAKKAVITHHNFLEETKKRENLLK